ncbi:hypothetical protein B0H11DRAFT_2298818 [Mycena galericulata]|nr:hypothetical protein B0H11DRAFT_2298818 [Mycena galericulata]
MESNAYLERLATETWANCWSFCEGPELKRLSLVCRYYRNLCQPLLFQTQRVTAPRIEPGNWMWAAQHLHQTAHRLTRLADSVHAASVRTWFWTGDSELGDGTLIDTFPLIKNIHVVQDTWLRVVTVFTSTLGAYTRLTVLHVEDLRIDEQFRATLVSLKLLEDLRLIRCEIAARTGTLLSLRKFGFSGSPASQSEEQFPIVGSHSLQEVSLDGSSDSACVIAALIDSPLPSLVRLRVSLTESVATLFFACLEQSPRLEVLEIRHLTPEFLPLPQHLAETTIPFLTSFSGPHTIVGLFANGRPVHDVTIWSDYPGPSTAELVSTLHEMSRSSTHVRSLDIRFALVPQSSMPDVFAAIGALFPALQRLAMPLGYTPRSALPSGSADEEDGSEMGDDEEEDAYDEEWGADDRVVFLWEGSLEALSDDDFELIDNDSDLEEPAPPKITPPVVELPGYMYVTRGDPYPPDFDDSKASSSSALSIIMGFISAGRIVLPPLLESLRFAPNAASYRLDGEIHLNDEHHAILALEKYLPCLTQIRLDDSWMRVRHVWRPIAGRSYFRVGEVKIISQVWNPDGTKRP